MEMSAMQTIELVDLTPKILELESLAASATNPKRVISKIDEIVRTTLHQGTVSYGLRVLSKHNYTQEQLQGLAQDYNKRGSEAGETLGAPYNIDPLKIKFFYMEKESNLVKIDLD
ncbi:MAG: hypothetical protein V1831_01070 [Candidatus Woesearchaeota archaeon]